MTEQQREFGFIQHFDGGKGRGYGFILPDAANWGKSLYFHFKDAENFADEFFDYQPGQPVSYVRAVSDRTGAPKASEIRFENADDQLGETGIVREWRADKGFGFIVADADKRSIFAHQRTILGNNGTRKLEAGDRVWFQRATNEKTQQPIAVNVMKIQEEEENQNESNS